MSTAIGNIENPKGQALIEILQKRLSLKRLQINRLLDITQAINNNVKSKELFEMYRSFLNWELDVKCLALFFKDKGRWSCSVSMGVEINDDNEAIAEKLKEYTNLKYINNNEDPFLNTFDVVIPVLHKESAIAYALVGGLEKDEEMFNKVQLITTITNVIAVAIENKRLFNRRIEQEKEQERLRFEMKLAVDMQKSLVPATFPESDHFELASIYQPHMGVGGDYYDCISFKKDRYLFCVADISGKGLAAALLMANFQANLHAIIRRATTPEEFIQQLNKAVLYITKGDKYITFFAVELDVNTRRLRYINAGHVPPYLVIQGKAQPLTKGCSILGFFKQLPKVEVGEIFLEDDALLLIFTDGLTDVKNAAGQFFDETLIAAFAEEHCQMEVEDFNIRLMQKLDAFRGNEIYPDDITVLTCSLYK